MKIPRDAFPYMIWRDRVVTVAAQGTELAPENPDRAVLILSHNIAGFGRVGLRNMAPAQSGITLTVENHHLIFTFWEHGTLAAQRWVTTDGTAGDWYVIEGIIERDPCSKQSAQQEQTLTDAVARAVESVQSYQYGQG